MSEREKGSEGKLIVGSDNTGKRTNHLQRLDDESFLYIKVNQFPFFGILRVNPTK
jgi:hypothetical protein